jgi:hypothetical protein
MVIIWLSRVRADLGWLLIMVAGILHRTAAVENFTRFPVERCRC